MEVLLTVLVIVLVLGGVLAATGMGRRRLARSALTDELWRRFEQIKDETPGLTLTATEDGRPRLTGLLDGLAIEIDFDNYVAHGLQQQLGMRCDVPEASMAPNAAVYIGGVDALHTQFGRPRALGDSEGLFDVYTRAEPSASDWWQERELHELLLALPGAGVLLLDGRLTVLFSDLDAESVQAAMRVPALIRQGVERVTLH